MILVCIAFSHVEIISWNNKDFQARESWSKNKLTAIALVKANFWFACHVLQLDKFYCTSFEVIEFSYFCMNICHVAFISTVASSNKSSEFKLISLYIFLLKRQSSVASSSKSSEAKLISLFIFLSIRKTLYSLYYVYIKCCKFKQIFRISFHFAFHFSFKTLWSRSLITLCLANIAYVMWSVKKYENIGRKIILVGES